MDVFLRLTRVIDAINIAFGKVAIWLVLLAALVSAFNAFFRYALETLISLGRGSAWIQAVLSWYSNNSNGLLEMQWYMFAGMVLLGGAHTLKVNEHVRVDLFYGSVSARTRTWIDLIGGLFCLVPMCILLIYFTWPWFISSWLQNEGSTNAGGLLRWPVKLLLPVGFTLLLAQAISEIIKCIAELTTDYRREYSYEKPLQ